MQDEPTSPGAEAPKPEPTVANAFQEAKEAFVAADPAVYAPVQGGWGQRGATNVLLRKARVASLRTALMAAWRNVAPAMLAKRVNVS